MSSSEVRIDVKLFNVAGALTGNVQRDDIEPSFDVNVKLEEIDRSTTEAAFNFAIAMNTKPSIVRFDVNGIVRVFGESKAVDKLLETDPETKVPYLLKKIYQQIFVSIFLLSGIMNAPHPPPDLLFLSVKNEVGKTEENPETEE
ncbi:hypothetical protein DRO22_03005 [Candidatus Bathyarchaeota archaeon]|nr:MAG: hypothetical protein DRO22_03005 [Candidatus Bathyarchaeota archaeon]